MCGAKTNQGKWINRLLIFFFVLKNFSIDSMTSFVLRAISLVKTSWQCSLPTKAIPRPHSKSSTKFNSSRFSCAFGDKGILEKWLVDSKLDNNNRHIRQVHNFVICLFSRYCPSIQQCCNVAAVAAIRSAITNGGTSTCRPSAELRGRWSSDLKY